MRTKYFTLMVAVMVLAASALPSTTSAAHGAGGGVLAPRTLVVDDDKRQCRAAKYGSIQDAVDTADQGDLIRVCPGRYKESTIVTKTLTLSGDPVAVEAVDCFNQQSGDVDEERHAIVDGSRDDSLALLTLAADGIVLEGFVLQNAGPNIGPFNTSLRRAIQSRDHHSGYQIHHNLLQFNTVAIEFGSNGETTSRVDHNCLRHNSWGLATTNRNYSNARVDHNATLDTQNTAFEAAAFGDRRVSITFDHNVSRQDNVAYLLIGSTGSRIAANRIESSRVGIEVSMANTHLEIANNVIGNPLGGNRFAGGVSVGIGLNTTRREVLNRCPSTDIVVRENTITGMGTVNLSGRGIVAAPITVPLPTGTDLQIQILDNVTSDNRLDGIFVRSGNMGLTVRGNVAERNGRNGIYAEKGAINNLFEANYMFGNGVTDARDEGQGNTWSANQCVTDIPDGICPVE